MDEKPVTPFEGFESSNTTPVPDILFDELLSELSGSELKVLLYIIRRTWGFKKDTDAISLSQFTDGIITKDKKVLDKGCGIKNRTVVSKALASLESKKMIKSTKGKDPLGDQATNLYSIRFKSQRVVTKPYYPMQEGSNQTVLPVVSKVYYGSIESVPGVVTETYPQETVIQLDSNTRNSKQEEYVSANAESAGVCSHTELSLQSPIAMSTRSAPRLQARLTIEEPSPPGAETRTKEAPARAGYGPPVMPPENAQWCAETAVQVVEAMKGRRYGEATRKQELAQAAKALDFKIDGTHITRAQFVTAWREMEGWSVWGEKHITPLIRHLVKDDKIVTLLERTRRAPPSEDSPKVRPFVLVSEAQSKINKERMHARAEAVRATQARKAGGG